MPLRAIPLSKMPHWMLAATVLLCGVLLSGAVSAEPVEGLAMHGKPKHAAGLQAFSVLNPDAPKGGRIVLGALGTFDSLNPFIIRGVTPSGVREYVFESLMARSGDEPFSLYGLIAQSRRDARRPQLDHLPSSTRGTLLGRHAHHAGGRAVQPPDPEGEGLALPSLALRQGQRGGEDRPAQRALHLQLPGRSRDTAHHGPAARPAATSPDP